MNKFFTLILVCLLTIQMVHAQQTVTQFPYTQNFDDWDICSGLCDRPCDINEADPRNNYNPFPATDTMSWRVFRGRSFSVLTGPSSDVSGSGNYMLAESSQNCADRTISFESPFFAIPSGDCYEVSFFLHMFGFTQNTFSVQAIEKGSNTADLVYTASGNQGPGWQNVAISGDQFMGKTVKFKFTAELGNTFSDIAIDEFYIGIPKAPAFAVCKDTISVSLDNFGNAQLLSDIVVTDSTKQQICYDDATLQYDSYISGPGTTFSDFNRINCQNIGLHNAEATVFTRDGRTATCEFILEVEDELEPKVECVDVSVTLNNANGGVAVINKQSIIQSLSDNCSSFSTLFSNASLSRTEFRCEDLGSNPVPVFLYTEDESGNDATCVSNVSLIIENQPALRCNNRTGTNPVKIGNDGTYTVNPADFNFDFDVTNSYPCPTQLVVTTNPQKFACSQIGTTQAVTFFVTDPQGNRYTTSCNVDLVDITPPKTNACKSSETIYLDQAGTANVQLSNLLSMSVSNLDNCGIDMSQTRVNPTSFNCGDANQTNKANLVLVDNSGNKSFCSVNVLVLDTISPDVVCINNIDVLLEDQDRYIVSPSEVIDNNATTDNCGIANMTIQNPLVTCDFNGQLIVNVTDVNGNTGSCSVTPNIIDKVSPNAVCKDELVLTLDPTTGNAAMFDPMQLNNGSFDNCSGTKLTYRIISGPTTFNCTNDKFQEVQLQVEDEEGNVASCISKVKAEDITPPTIVCVNSVTLTVDATGVVDITNPLDFVNANTTTDNCTDYDVTLSQSEFNCKAIPNNKVEITVFATDKAGNVASCTSNVIIEDDTDPTAICAPVTIQLDHSGFATLDPAELGKNSTDNCQISGFNSTETVFNCKDFSDQENGTPVEVELTVTDLSGNTSTPVQCTITLEDNEAPEALCKEAFELAVDDVCELELTFDKLFPFIDNGSIDNCAINGEGGYVGAPTVSPFELEFDGNTLTSDGLNSTGSPVTFTDADLNRTIPVTLTATDHTGNQGTCSTSFTIIDNKAPEVLNCVQVNSELIEVYLDDLTQGGETSLTSLDLINPAAPTNTNITTIRGAGNPYLTIVDNCPFNPAIDQVLPLSPASNETYDYRDLFTTRVLEVTAIDVSGNTTNCNVNVMAVDITDPILDCAATYSALVGPETFDFAGPGSILGTSSPLAAGSNTDNADPYIAGIASSTVLTAKLNGNPISFIKRGDLASEVKLFDGSFLPAEGAILDIGCDPYLLTNSPSPNILELTATDESGNVATCDVDIQNSDVAPPASICVGVQITQEIDSSGFLILDTLDLIDVPNFVNNNTYNRFAVDNSGCFDVTYPNLVYDCSNIGLNTVNITVTDVAGLSTNCSVDILIEDNILPLFIDTPAHKDFCLGDPVILQEPTIEDPNGCTKLSDVNATPEIQVFDATTNSFIAANANDLLNVNNQVPGLYKIIWTITDNNGVLFPGTLPVETLYRLGQDVTLVDIRSLKGSNPNFIYIRDSDQLVFDCNGVLAPRVVDNQGNDISGDTSLSYSWSTGDSIRLIQNLCPGTYTVTVTSGSCVDTRTFNINWTFFGLFDGINFNFNANQISDLQDLFRRLSGKTGMTEEEFARMILEGENGAVAVFPNPTSSFINVELFNPGQHDVNIVIYDIIGSRSVHTEQVSFTDEYKGQIDLSGFANGHYLVQIHGPNGVVTRKIVKQ